MGQWWQGVLNWVVSWNDSQGFWTAVQAVGTLVAAVAALVAVFIARSQLAELIRSNKLLSDSNDAMTASNVAATRPYITVDLDFRPALSRSGGMHAVSLAVKIENIGRTPAKNLRLKLDAPFETAAESSGGRDFSESISALNRLMDGETVIKTLTPVRPMTYFVGDNKTLMADQTRAAEWTVTASYEDAAGQEFTEEFSLELEHWKLALVNADPLQRIAKNLEGVAYEVKSKRMPSLDFDFPMTPPPRIGRPTTRGVGKRGGRRAS
jgi:hypothetical protein